MPDGENSCDFDLGLNYVFGDLTCLTYQMTSARVILSNIAMRTLLDSRRVAALSKAHRIWQTRVLHLFGGTNLSAQTGQRLVINRTTKHFHLAPIGPGQTVNHFKQCGLATAAAANNGGYCSLVKRNRNIRQRGHAVIVFAEIGYLNGAHAAAPR